MGAALPPYWLVPPLYGITADAFLEMYDLPWRTELSDGCLRYVADPGWWHTRCRDLIQRELDSRAPAELRAVGGIAVRLGERQAPIPDIVVVSAESFWRKEPDNHFFPEDVVLVVEVSSPESEERDRDRKSFLYAAAGIPHYWHMRREDGRQVVYVHERDSVTGRYELSDVQRDRIERVVPFAMDFDISDVNRRRL
ncbi:Uncharacterized protein conserved in cyanobacteria [Mycobacterium tuberculosis]|nr:Uncharacterized protein conserved in cyanobacteria [Mycobacterium tuberculosis]